jgi:hypothetical protein
MTTAPQTSKEYFKALTVLHAAIALGQVMTGAILYYISISGTPIAPNDNLLQVFRWLVPVVVAAAYFGGKLFMQKRLLRITENDNIIKKMTVYKAAVLTRSALLSFASMTSLIAFYLTSNLLYLAFAAMVVVLLVMLWPSKEKAKDELSLSNLERAIIDNPDAIISDTAIDN